jgi:hypothetical protein
MSLIIVMNLKSMKLKNEKEIIHNLIRSKQQHIKLKFPNMVLNLLEALVMDFSQLKTMNSWMISSLD